VYPEHRRLLQLVCEDPFVALDETDHREDEAAALRGQAAISIRGEGRTERNLGYADFDCT
jgi:hypothetical protein